MGEKTSIGLEENIAGLLCYLLGLITGIVFYVIEKDNKFVRFHAVQSILVFGAILVISWVVIPIVAFIPILGAMVGVLLSLVVSLGSLVLWILLMYKAYSGEKYKVPVVGDLAEKYV
ncbi:MAG: DUF4870 domain-containing protein [Candidatus Hydrothermarchaeales archaeon]